MTRSPHIKLQLSFLSFILIFSFTYKEVSATVQPVAIYDSGSNVCIEPGQGLYHVLAYQQMKYTFNPSIHTSWSQVSNSGYWSQAGYGGYSGSNQLADNTCYVADPTYPHSAYNNSAYYIYFAVTGSKPIYYYFKYFYNDGDITTINPDNYYAPIKNTTGSLGLKTGSSTSSEIIKSLPQDWVVYVNEVANASGTPYTADGYNWYYVTDPTDNVSGWMIGENASGTIKHLPYIPTQMSAYEASSSDYVATSSRPDLILSVISHYYNDVSTTTSLYSSDDGYNEISILKDEGFEEKVIWGIAAQESGPSPFLFNNEIVTYDYGHGIMQLTLSPSYPFDNRGYADTVKIYPCELDSDKYEECYSEPDPTNYYLRTYIPYASSTDNPTYKQYTNTKQSIYANIKDGLSLLADKYSAYSYITSSTTVNGIEYSPLERKTISAVASYNGACDYLEDVADKLSQIDDYFSTATTSDITNLIDKMETAGSESICASLHSPGDISIVDSNGMKAGVVEGEGVNELPIAVYDKSLKTVKVLAAENKEDYSIIVEGTGRGTYKLNIDYIVNGKLINFMAKDIAILPNQRHTYTLQKEGVSDKDVAMVLSVDREDDGVVDRIIPATNVLTAGVYNAGASAEELKAYRIGTVHNPVTIKRDSVDGGPIQYSRDLNPRNPSEPRTTKLHGDFDQYQ